jgi:transcriptional regulator with PAS, ATPase and Fis domain
MAAEHSESVLILGDTGTGKEVVARAIHRFSPRAHYNFTPVNCGAIPEYLFESELFGYEAGAFTGALTKKIGLWKTADKGTLFLDEVGDLSLNNQVKILRALEDKKIRPIGSTKEIKVDARIITATNKNLSAMVDSGEFREDLLYRLMSFQIYTPPLRSNQKDIPEIAQSFWDQITNKSKDPLPPDILNELKAYRWPGNGRELRMVLMKLYTYFKDKKLSSDHLKMIFLLQGQIHAGRIKRTAQQDKLEHKANYHRHLSRTVEVLRAIKVALRPIFTCKAVTSQARANIYSMATTQVAELDILCLRPNLFQKKETYDRVRKLKDLYRDFLSILKKSTKRARENWDNSIDAEYEEVMSLLFIKIEELIK